MLCCVAYGCVLFCVVLWCLCCVSVVLSNIHYCVICCFVCVVVLQSHVTATIFDVKRGFVKFAHDNVEKQCGVCCFVVPDIAVGSHYEPRCRWVVAAQHTLHTQHTSHTHRTQHSTHSIQQHTEYNTQHTSHAQTLTHFTCVHTRPQRIHIAHIDA